MILITSVLGLICIALIVLIHEILKSAKEERSELEDRLMALSKPDAIILHKAARDRQPAGVSYVGEGTAYDPEKNGHLNSEDEDD